MYELFHKNTKENEPINPQEKKLVDILKNKAQLSNAMADLENKVKTVPHDQEDTGHTHSQDPDWKIELNKANEIRLNNKHKNLFGAALVDINKRKSNDESIGEPLTHEDILNGVALLSRAKNVAVLEELTKVFPLIQPNKEHHTHDPKESWKVEQEKDKIEELKKYHQKKFLGCMLELQKKVAKINEDNKPEEKTKEEVKAQNDMEVSVKVDRLLDELKKKIP